MLASTWLDLVIGVDLHFELVPPVMAPVPFPHPFVGLVFDPWGLLGGLVISNVMSVATGGSLQGPVLINLMPATTTGTDAKNWMLLPHFIIPPGVMWAPMVRVPKPSIIPGKPIGLELPIPPPGDAVVITGSKTVHAMGANLCRLGDIALSCSDPIRLPTAAILTIPKGMPVLVGGPPALDLMAAAFALIKCKWVANRLHKLVNRIKNARLRNLLNRVVCFFTGHPVDVATGRVMTQATDFELPGPLPLQFERVYASSWADRASPVGRGWSHSLDQAVWLEPGKVVYRAEDGREIELDTFELPGRMLQPGQESFEPLNRLLFRCLDGHRWEVESAEGLVHEFAPVAGDADPAMARLTRKRSRQGHAITLHYDGKGCLTWVQDSGGRIVRFEHDEAGHLTQVSLPHPTQPGWLPHTRYIYSPEGDLVEVVDPLGHRTRYEYVGHLLVRETDRTGLSFYFGYDGTGPGAYCIRTWGDGGIYDHEIDYDKVNRVTFVTDSLGATTTYEMNVANAVVKVIDPRGGETRYEYNDVLWKTEEVEPAGGATRYEYDARGNCTKSTGPDGATVQVEYDARNVPIRAVNPCGEEWQWVYDAQGQLVERIDPLGETTRYEYDKGMVVTITEASGVTTAEYDDSRNLRRVQGPSEAETSYVYDALGRMVVKRSPARVAERLHYDACGRLVTVEQPDGNVWRLAYDGEGNLTEIQDHHQRVRMRYGGYHQMVSRQEAEDTTLFRYDSEGRLVAIENEAGEIYQYELDSCGRAGLERGFDGGCWKYERDAAGRVIKLRKPSGAEARLIYDAMGRLVEVRRSDSAVERFRYRKDGALIEAENSTIQVKFERDALGRVVREMQGGHWVESSYERGARTWVASSLGVHSAIMRDERRSVVAMTAGRGVDEWRVELSRDAFGLETERKLSSGIVSTWARDALGRPRHRGVAHSNNVLFGVEYQWAPGSRLVALIDTERGTTAFHFDERSRLVGAKLPGGRIDRREPDRIGNIYRAQDQRDRTYSDGGILRGAGETRYTHDLDGNLTQKVLPDGATWSYSYNAAGCLKEVERPDGTRVTFAYDALGRRVSKRWGENEVWWLWDRHVPLHEISTRAEPITWLFEPESFAPIAKIEGDRHYDILCDHLGAPTVVLDEAGVVTWRARLDIHAAVQPEIAETECPWRWPGQYEDQETGLYYNRFRYYDPEADRYISQDPLGPVGGLNLYSYAADPLTWSDPLGLQPDPPPPPTPMGNTLPGWDGGKTQGWFVYPDGTERHLISGYDGPSKFTQGIPGMNGNIKSHVEAHAAALMRQYELSKATLYINRVPCPGVRGCDALLARMLPEGVQLEIIGPNGFKKTYTGLPDPKLKPKGCS
ncbi:DUF6531 domain-containing protein [Chondromyces apiculatus]|uniref:Type IV secretion protein Rhs n=1 Tax=Chondromyces apiculatus DSM 436 TaxID=1192034 RepID=A0A017THP5_9BACT|nr:DUF6531 domain-containing protein [Chondromyces apiculatus]EYF08101.1 Hypothetical protein CAP_5861 [Chondromyces apiculatus DSM 436]